MLTVAGIIDALGGFRAVADTVRVPRGTASAWKTRGSIPSVHWQELVADAQRRKIPSVTLEALAAAHARRSAEAPVPVAVSP